MGYLEGLCHQFATSQVLMDDQLERLQLLCDRVRGKFLGIFVLNINFGVVVVVAFALGVLLYRQNRKEYNDEFNKRKRLQYFYVVKHGADHMRQAPRRV